MVGETFFISNNIITGGKTCVTRVFSVKECTTLLLIIRETVMFEMSTDDCQMHTADNQRIVN